MLLKVKYRNRDRDGGTGGRIPYDPAPVAITKRGNGKISA